MAFALCYLVFDLLHFPTSVNVASQSLLDFVDPTSISFPFAKQSAFHKTFADTYMYVNMNYGGVLNFSIKIIQSLVN